MMPPFKALPPSMQNEEAARYYQLLRHRRGRMLVKRLFDLTTAFVLLIPASVLMGVIAVMICAQSPGGAIFRQRRVTQYGQLFTIYKFRTMYSGSADLSQLSGKVTPIGRVLRRTHLDELPQLVNILRGEMSFVGPRPEVPHFVHRYRPEMLATLLLPAGVTSRASIAFRNEETLLPSENREEYYIRQILPMKMNYNLEYLNCFSLWEDMKILAATLFPIHTTELERPH